jgi:hypothetical protein
MLNPLGREHLTRWVDYTSGEEKNLTGRTRGRGGKNKEIELGWRGWEEE